MSNIRSKSSTYVNSLVNFTLDTKPYHSKLTEVAIEYRFDETMNVRIEDAVASRLLKKAGWMYSFVSGGEGALRTMPFQRLVQPDVLRAERTDNQPQNPGRWQVGNAATTNTDMMGVPFVYAKKGTIGYAEVLKERAGLRDVLVRGHDYFHSYGSSELRVSLAPANDADQTRRWQPTNAEGVMSTVTAATQQVALNISNPNSANRRIRHLLLQIQAQLVSAPKPAATAELDALLAIIDTPDLPRSYENLLAELAAAPVTPLPPGFTGWVGEDNLPAPGDRYVDDAFSQLTPPAYFNFFADSRLREGSTVTYHNAVSGSGFVVTNAQPMATTVPEEWTLEVFDLAPLTLSVRGSHSGFIGTVAVGSSFTSSFITFNTAATIGTPSIGDRVFLTPVSRLVVGSTAPTEVWNLIKTDPLAYSRPVFASPRYGSIQDLSGNLGHVTILDQTLPTGTVVLTATSPTQFALTSTAELSYTGTATVGVNYGDGRLGFLINASAGQPYQIGDRYYIHIVNRPAEAVEFDLYFGYDLDSYDNLTSVYNNTNPLGVAFNQPLEFRYDTRFVDYDLSAMNLQIAENAVPGRRFKLTALADGDPVATLKKDGSGPTNAVDLTDPTTGVPPDPALNSVPQFSMPGDPNAAPDLLVYYANSFVLEYSDDNFTTSTFVANVAVNGTYSNPALGISFSLPNGSKPFIAVSSDAGLAVPRVEGGDVFMFRVVNDPPVLDPAPIAFSSPNTAYLLMHGAGFWRAPGAQWQVVFTSPTEYEVRATYSTGPLVGLPLAGYPRTGAITTTGAGTYQNWTYKDDLVHFTIRAGAVGFDAGDTFSFETYDHKPSVLVHGTVSGWQPEATIGEWYWNGRIGFKLNPPRAAVFQGTGLATTDLDPGDPDYGLINVTFIRPDTTNLVYTFTRLTSSFIVNRSDVGIVGYAALNGEFSDDYITVSLISPASSFMVQVIADELQFWNGEDTIVVRPTISALQPQVGDFISVRKAEEAKLAIALSYDGVPSPPSISPLFPLGINDDFVDLDTGPLSPPIERYSPEATISNGWLPLMVDGYDATNSIAFFPDEASSQQVRSAATNQPIGRVFSLGNINEPIQFEWDPVFYDDYLKLNTRAFLVNYGTFMDEKVKVRMHERLTVLTSGGVLLEDALFTDRVNVSITEEWNWWLTMEQQESMNVVVQDSPFGGFLPGYANLPYDAEDALGLDAGSLAAALGQYDTGAPLVDNYLRAQYLAALAAPSTAEVLELTTLSALIDPYLQPGGLGATSLVQFLAALDADPFAASTVAPEMGLPVRGLGIDINRSDTEATTASISAAANIMLSANISSMDQEDFDVDGLDTIEDSMAILVAATAPPVPTPSPPFVSYASLETPLFTTVPVRTFVVSFPVAVPSTPTFTVWASGAPAQVQIPVVVRESARSFSFSIAAPSEVKVVVT